MDGKKPRVSVVVPNYNHAVYLKERIDSILNQTYQDYEIIILDDCSTDNSRQVIDAYRNNPHVSHIVYNEKNTGSPFLQWSKGIGLAQGEYVWIAESDDVALPEFLSKLVEQLEGHPDAVLAFSHSFLTDSNGNKLEKEWNTFNGDRTLVHTAHDFSRDVMAYRCYIYNASMAVFRREAYYKMDQSYMQYRSCGDYAFWMSLCLLGKVIEVCLQLNCFRQHEAKVSAHASKTGNDWKEVAAILNGFVDQLQLKGLRLRIFRGKWTRDIQFSHSQNIQELVRMYPRVLDGSRLDVFLYRLSKLFCKQKYV